MALIYKIQYPDDILTTAANNEAYIGTNTANVLGNDNELILRTDFRPQVIPIGLNVVPNQDIASKDFKVSSKLEEVNSKVTYDISFVGTTARQIVDYITYIRLPEGTDAYPEPSEGLEYLFNTDKQIKITITDDCCLGATEGTFKLVLDGFIPLNTIRYCDDEGCKVNCTIYEDGNRVNAIKCLESTVLGVRSNIGILQSAEIYTDKVYEDQTGENTQTQLASQYGKWFESCISPQSPGMALIILSQLGFLRFLLATVISPILAVLFILVAVINGIILAVNIVPGINLSLIDFPPILDPASIIDDIIPFERIVEGLFGCKYVRGGFRVASVLGTVCSICDFSQEKIRDIYEEFLPVAFQFKTPITFNPFIQNGNITTTVEQGKLDTTYNTAYIPAEECFQRRQGDNADPSDGPDTLKNVAVRAASIETTDKVLSRLGSLWGTKWDVANVPVTESTPNGIQLQLGPLEGKYCFKKGEFVDIEEATICYTVGEGQPIGYSTTWLKDASDEISNKQQRNSNGYVTYYYTELKDRKPKDVKDFQVDFAPVHYINSLKADSVYDDLRNGAAIFGFGDRSFREYFEEGVMINGTEITSQPKLVTFNIGDVAVLNGGKACRVKEHNQYFSGAYRMSDTVDTRMYDNFGTTTLTANTDDLPQPTGLQSKIPYYTLGYFGKNDVISNVYTNDDISIYIQDYLDKYGSSEVGYTQAKQRVRSAEYSFLGPFNNITDSKTVPVDNKGYKFAPLMEFSFELENYSCGQEDLLSQCVTEAVVDSPNDGIDEGEVTAFKLRLIKLKLGLGVVTELEIDYENRKIEASGYVIPFVQNGVDYSK